MFISTGHIAFLEITLIASDRVLMRGDVVAAEIDKAGRDNLEEVCWSAEKADESCKLLTLKHVVRYLVSRVSPVKQLATHRNRCPLAYPAEDPQYPKLAVSSSPWVASFFLARATDRPRI